MGTLNQGIRDIKNAMIAHNKSDDERFESILRKLDANHDVHIRNEETLKQILAQAQKTNGRVTNLEETCTRLDKGNALLHQIVSQQHGQYEKFVIQQEKSETGLVTKDVFEPVKKIVYGLVGLLLTGVVGSMLALVLRK